MGLAIYAYRQVELVEVLTQEEYEAKYESYGFDTEHVNEVYIDTPDFPEQLVGSTLVANGVYKVAEEFYFRAGSYSGYNAWREWLCSTFLQVTPEEVWSNPEKYRKLPFYYLINFSDCEGVIAGDAVTKLLQDFQDHQTQADEIGGEYLELYNNWCKAFELAADGGYVSFY